jgi:hypothetical protein
MPFEESMTCMIYISVTQPLHWSFTPDFIAEMNLDRKVSQTRTFLTGLRRRKPTTSAAIARKPLTDAKL